MYFKDWLNESEDNLFNELLHMTADKMKNQDSMQPIHFEPTANYFHTDSDCREEAKDDFRKSADYDEKYERQKPNRTDDEEKKYRDYQNKKKQIIEDLTSDCISGMKSYYTQYGHKNQMYEVNFTKSLYKTSAGFKFPKVYKIDFQGPHGFLLSGNAGSDAVGVYSKLLVVIKRFIDTHDLQGIALIPAQASMTIIYEKFLKAFAQDNFVRVDRYMLLKKDAFNRFVDQLSEDKKEKFLQEVQKYNQEYNQNISVIRKIKQQRKLFKRREKEFVGRFLPVFSKEVEPLVLLAVNPATDRATTLLYGIRGGVGGKLDISNISLDNIAIPFDTMPTITSQSSIIGALRGVNFSDKNLFPAWNLSNFSVYYELPDNNWPEKIPELLRKLQSVFHLPRKVGISDVDTGVTNAEWLQSSYPDAYTNLVNVGREYGIYLDKKD